MTCDSLSDFIRGHYQVFEWKHALTILENDFPSEWSDLCNVLEEFRLKKDWIVVGGGRKSKIAEAVDSEFARRGWEEKGFATQVVVDGTPRDNPTHKIDCYKNRIAVEVEWNNKDEFYDRDLNNFRILFELGAISVGVIITRSDELQSIFKDLGKAKSYGSSTTHWSQLIPRIQGGGAGGCPVVTFGITEKLYVE